MRHLTTNRNLTLNFESTYQGLPVMHGKGPLIHEYLSALHRVLSSAITAYREVYAFRFDCRLPTSHRSTSFEYENEIIDRFIESFKAKIRHNREKASRENSYAHDTVVRFVWCREVGGEGRPHYHFAILLNKDAFCAMGKYAPNIDNMYNRLHEAWASALGLPVEDVWGLVHVPDNATFCIRRDDFVSQSDFFFRTSYLCKAATKVYGHGGHCFGASRR